MCFIFLKPHENNRMHVSYINMPVMGIQVQKDLAEGVLNPKGWSFRGQSLLTLALPRLETTTRISPTPAKGLGRTPGNCTPRQHWPMGSKLSGMLPVPLGLGAYGVCFSPEPHHQGSFRHKNTGCFPRNPVSFPDQLMLALKSTRQQYSVHSLHERQGIGLSLMTGIGYLAEKT